MRRRLAEIRGGRRIDPVTASVIHGALEHIAVIKIDCASLCLRPLGARGRSAKPWANGDPND